MSTLEQELKQCREYAERGSLLAQQNYDAITQTLDKEHQRIDDADTEQDLSRMEATALFDQQREGLHELETELHGIKRDLDTIRRQAQDFSIIVFGRTMAGKSTLMEILTHGNGQSIGKGSQRTTRDVRSYHWNGLKITDVPGICAYGGEEDNNLALEAAKSADLILFLLTDDAPQADEAKFLAQLRSLGKPVLGVVNVKMAFDIKRKKLSIKRLKERLSDTSRLDEICRQFKQHASKYNQDWQEIPFVYAHLNAAFQAQPERGNDPEIYRASQLPQVEEFIVDKVRTDGKFLRIKTFIDAVSVPMHKIIDVLLEHSAASLRECEIYFNKAKELEEWSTSFIASAERRMETVRTEITGEVKTEIYTFADKNYENEEAGELWASKIKGMNLHEKYQELMTTLVDECETKRKALSDQLTQDLKVSLPKGFSVKVTPTDTTSYLSYALKAASVLSFLIPGTALIRIGASVAFGLASWLLGTSEEDIRKAKKDMRNALTKPTLEMVNAMHDDVTKVFKEEIVGKGIDGFRDVLVERSLMLARLASAQMKIANELNNCYKSLNMELIKEASQYIGSQIKRQVEDIARIPGEAMAIVSARDWKDGQQLSHLLDEKIRFLKPYDVSELVRRVLGSKYKVGNYWMTYSDDPDPQKTHMLFVDRNVDKNNLELARQFSYVPIVVEE